jgi:hypothetical protein
MMMGQSREGRSANTRFTVLFPLSRQEQTTENTQETKQLESNGRGNRFQVIGCRGGSRQGSQ